ncbi:drug resistance transporter, EmrB/QacA subfamily [Thermomonospora echinospora]|uniref:Drug resistance transporter, EmrB/QacA subfamily n=1 Tax=Thermomonospora echinospora TaxID=1992 RepID=A0A1H5VFV9_9ACTN|nr:MFS transporter [Thermomonospora echinospora]SEF85698.1 drug resistance transporter, EmrB/QacA subfamily [Thermomonospora echinospora]
MTSPGIRTGRHAPPKAPPAGGRQGIALLVIAMAQLMVVLDGTITNIALPSIQTDLGVSEANLAWIVNAYALAFGGLMLLGGKAGDLYGRRRVFRLGVAVFTAASLLGGFANGEAMLIAARVLQGVGAAVAAPTALSLIATTFPEGRPRNRAMGVYAAMSGLGATLGLLLGGTLTEYLDWRWVLFVNVPIGLAVLAGTGSLGEGERGHGRLDVPGALTGTTGMIALVYAITRGGEHGWGDRITLAGFACAAVLLAAFLALQARGRNPMLPLRLLRDRNRAGSYSAMLFIGAGMFATFYFLTLYMQLVLQYGAVETGLAYLPFSLGMGVSAGVGSQLASRVAPRTLAAPGLVVAAAGMGWLGTLTPDSSYTTALMPAMFVTAVGLGMSFVPMTLGAVSRVAEHETGIASALLNSAQQVGGALGLAALSTISTTAADDRLPHATERFFQGLAQHDFALVARAADALTHGYTRALWAAGACFAVALVITLTAVNAGRQEDAGKVAHLG